MKNNVQDKPKEGQATEEQLAEWRKKYTEGIFGVQKDGKIAYFKSPSFKEMDFYHSQASKTESVSDGWKVLAEHFFIGGCRELIESPKYLPNVSKKIQEGIYGQEAELVKL